MCLCINKHNLLCLFCFFLCFVHSLFSLSLSSLSLSLSLSHSLSISLSIALSLSLALSLSPSLFLSLSIYLCLSLFPSTLLLLAISTHHREGLSPPLAYTPLSESWSDHLFYFSTLSFKRSGNYTVSFLLEVSL